ncbi:phosphatidate cytidylyltransferase [Candidatus Mycoplasma haematohominis]|uniref:phosphatidate cytidylyltransferase n=1 Tax=Candidatus Mycoplasma haematohominis TaxID=1494318 RepID=UPI001C0A69FF|nr:phosphatidate cytidylyltransferase [Candidatus Mycoplasma haemohominis]
MVSIRKLKGVLSSRLKVGIAVVLALVLACFFSYLFQGSASSFHTFIFVFWVLLLFPFVWLSIREILLLRKEGFFDYRIVGSLVSFLIFVPIFVSFVMRSGFSYDFKPILGYGIVSVCCLLFLLWGLSKLLVGVYTPWVDFRICARNKSFTSLLVSAGVFWNSVFFMTVFAPWYVLAFIFLFVVLNDSFALLFGCLFGRTPLIEYSPKKSWEGLIIAVLLSLLICVAMFYLIPISSLPAELFFSLFVWFLLIANMGDIYYSMHKRLYRIKDYSNLLKSHGGFWDRFDSQCFALVVGSIVSLLWYSYAY